MNWLFNFSIAGAQQALAQLRGHMGGMFNQMSSGITSNIMKFNAWQVALDYCVDAGKKLINESRELIAISAKYDIPISKMGQLQVMANSSGQSVGQLARGFRFLEMNMNKALLKPGGPQDQALKELGISQAQITRASKDTMYAMDLVRGSVMKIGDEERRNAFLQQIFGANWQNMLPLIEQSATAQKDAATAGYQYSSSMTESLSGVATTMEEIAQDVKPVIMPIVQVVAMLATILGMLIEGLKLMIILVGKTLLAAFQAVWGIVKAIVGGVLKAASLVKYLPGGGQLGRSLDKAGSAVLSSAGDSFKEAGGRFTSMGGDLTKSQNEQSKNLDRLTRQGYAFGESVGVTNEGAYVKDRLKALEEGEKKLKENREAAASLRVQYQLIRDEQKHGRADANAHLEIQEDMNRLAEESYNLTQKQKATREELDRAGYKAAADPNFKPRTEEERKVELQRNRQSRERDIKMAMAQTPIGQELETYFGIVKQKEEILKLEEDLAELQRNHADDIQKKADMEHSIALAKITLIEKEREHEAFLLKQQRARDDSFKGRKDAMIKTMQDREQTFMTRQGMTGMDKQAVTVQNAIEQMQRDEEQLKAYLADPKRKQEERMEAQKKFEASTQSALKELDKFTLMQFQFSASDAAKKGMGGGIDIRENQLTVAKSSLEYLRKSYELQLKEFGLTPDMFGNVPFMMMGPMRSQR